LTSDANDRASPTERADFKEPFVLHITHMDMRKGQYETA
jgi:hypothetical protein